MHQAPDSKVIPMTSFAAGKGTEVRDDVFYYTNQIVNLVMLGKPGGTWVLVDAGMPQSAETIIKVVEDRFGAGARPDCIILTHGHFDHVGSIVDLIKTWQVPVFAHPLEFDFLTDKRSYPEPDPTVEGGLLAKLASLYPYEPINIAPVLQELPTDGTIPGISGWRWVHTPGHSPGHVALFREGDRTLISGDAFVTVRQDSFYKVLIQKKEVNGPPRYLTTNWTAAWDSVRKLNALKPNLVVPGHGQYMEGSELKEGLERLAEHFDTDAIPAHGKYVEERDKQAH